MGCARAVGGGARPFEVDTASGVHMIGRVWVARTILRAPGVALSCA